MITEFADVLIFWMRSFGSSWPVSFFVVVIIEFEKHLTGANANTDF